MSGVCCPQAVQVTRLRPPPRCSQTPSAPCSPQRLGRGSATRAGAAFRAAALRVKAPVGRGAWPPEPGVTAPGCALRTRRLEVEDLTRFLRRAGRHLDGWAGSLVNARMGVCLEWIQVWRAIAETTDPSVGNTTHFSREDIFSERQSNGIK